MFRDEFMREDFKEQQPFSDSYFKSAFMGADASPFVSPPSMTISPPLSASSQWTSGVESVSTSLSESTMSMASSMVSSMVAHPGLAGSAFTTSPMVPQQQQPEYTYDMDYYSNEEFSSNEMEDLRQETVPRRRNIRHSHSMDSVGSMSSFELDMEPSVESSLSSMNSSMNSPQQSGRLPAHHSHHNSTSSTSSQDSRISNDLVKKGVYTEWVKLSRMTPQRVERIKALGKEKGIDAATVEAVLTLYANTQRIDNDINRYRGEDVYIKITMGSALLEEPELLANSGPMTSMDDSVVGSSSKLRRKSSLDDLAGSNTSQRNNKLQHRRSKSANYIKRPLNSFMLYRRSQTQSAMAFAMSSQLKLNHQNISQIIGLMWQTEQKEIKDEFAKFAGQEKELHKILYPDYKFCPQKRRKRSV